MATIHIGASREIRVREPKRLAVLNLDGREAPAGEAAPGVVPWLVDPRVGVLPRTPYDRLLCEIAAVDAAERAIESGCDAVLIHSFGDYGLAAVRSLTEMPVVGAGETAIQRAADLGRFAVVTVWPRSMGYIYADRLTEVAGGERCVAVRHVAGDEEIDRPGGGADLHRRAIAGDGDIASRVAEMCRDAVDRDRVDAIVFGCTCMTSLASTIAADCPVPVIDPAVAGYEYAVELLLGRTPKPARDASPPVGSRHAGRIRELVDGWSEQASPPPDEACGVCLTA